ncbi:MAG: 1-acyl-sn-glycerol-3-phosphate acyltransferase [Prevotellaceae bacterium]|nr:1-acyl-sn-glycerol-3-phosphate acyltransferase [Prevotellaceae bacterium]
MSNKKIDTPSLGYNLLRKVMIVFLRIYYRRIAVRGQEHIPKGEAVIFAPNHKNALMDTLLILYAYRCEPVVFMARGDIFRKGLIAACLRFLKILPVFRMQNGVENLAKNALPFEEAADTLKNRHKLCLMPEGRQVERRQLLPLVKGMFRIGMKAQERFGVGEGVKIIPTGIEYDDLLHSGRTVTIQFGSPVDLADYYDLYTENAPQAYNSIREVLYPKISELCLNVRSKDNYATVYLQALLETDDFLQKNGLENTAWNRLHAKQALCRQWENEEKNNTPTFVRAKQRAQAIYASGKTDDAIARLIKKPKAVDFLLMLTALPLFIVGSLLMLPPCCLIKYATKKLLNSGFYATVSFVMGIVVPLVFFILYFLTGLLFLPAAGTSALFFLVLAPILAVTAFKLKEIYFDTIGRCVFGRRFRQWTDKSRR